MPKSGQVWAEAAAMESKTSGLQPVAEWVWREQDLCATQNFMPSEGGGVINKSGKGALQEWNGLGFEHNGQLSIWDGCSHGGVRQEQHQAVAVVSDPGLR